MFNITASAILRTSPRITDDLPFKRRELTMLPHICNTCSIRLLTKSRSKRFRFLDILLGGCREGKLQLLTQHGNHQLPNTCVNDAELVHHRLPPITFENACGMKCNTYSLCSAPPHHNTTTSKQASLNKFHDQELPSDS